MSVKRFAEAGFALPVSSTNLANCQSSATSAEQRADAQRVSKPQVRSVYEEYPAVPSSLSINTGGRNPA